MTERRRIPPDTLHDAERDHPILSGALFHPVEVGLRPVGTRDWTDGYRGRYRVRSDGLLVLDHLRVRLADARNARPVFGVQPSFPDGLPDDGAYGMADYDFLPAGVAYVYRSFALIVGDDYDANLARAAYVHGATEMSSASRVAPYRIVRELRFELVPIGADERTTRTVRSQTMGLRLVGTRDHSAALNAIRERLGPPYAGWMQLFAIEASRCLGATKGELDLTEPED